MLMIVPLDSGFCNPCVGTILGHQRKRLHSRLYSTRRATEKMSLEIPILGDVKKQN